MPKRTGRTNTSRKEEDLLGEIDVPASALYGAQTCRAIQNFPLQSAKAIGDYPEMIRALMVIKKAAAQCNARARLLDKRKSSAIAAAADSVMEGNHQDQFPVHSLHGGGGTSANMNANEVLANLAEEFLGGHRGRYALVHPNDHVNLNQSTNDVYPTACHIAVILKWPQLEQKLHGLHESLLGKARQWRQVKRLARTCLQDAVEITFGDLFGAYAGFVERSAEHVEAAIDRLHEVNLGGTIVGRKEDVPKRYLETIIKNLREVAGDNRYRQAHNLFLSAQSPDDLVAVSSALDQLARGLVKIAQDFRLLGSGPEGGLAEIHLPPMQPGSSIMPGKVNPVIPEFLIQLCFKISGNHSASAMALDHGELDLNVWESVLVFNILDSMDLLASGVSSFRQHCVAGLDIDVARNRSNADTIIPLLTELMKRHGYSRISGLCKQAAGDPQKIRALLREQKLI